MGLLAKGWHSTPRPDGIEPVFARTGKTKYGEVQVTVDGWRVEEEMPYRTLILNGPGNNINYTL